MMMSGYNIKDLVQEAQFRWLRPGEVVFILQNYEETQLNHEPPQKPPSGSLFMFNKRVLRFFRKDGHSWRRKKDGKNVGEAHERLKVGNVEALNCYYAHGEENPNFQRRSYWMLDSAIEHIVLVHYRDITIGKHSAEPISTLTYGSSNIIQSSNSYTTRHPLSAAVSEFDETYNSTSGPSFIEVSPDIVINSDGASRLNLTDITDNIHGSPDIEIDQALRRLEEQLSLDHVKDIGTVYNQNEFTDDLGFTINEQHYSASEVLQYGSDDYLSLQYPVLDKPQEHLGTFRNCATDYGRLHQYQQLPNDEFTIPCQQTLIWKDVLKYNGNAACDGSLENFVFPPDKNEVLLPQPQRDPVEDHVKQLFGNTGASNDSCILLSQELEDSTFPARNMYQSDVDVYSTLFDQGQIGTPLTSDSSLTISQDQKFTIREISPEWVYASEPTKVLIVGTFTCDPSNNEWICMFGDTEVPVEIIQEGVICCHAPPRSPGKVTICITSGNREACSEVREFEYRDKPNKFTHNTNLTENESSRSSEELLLLVKFVQILLTDKIGQNGKSTDLMESSMAGEDSWAQVIESLSDGGLESSRTTDWLLEELLKDKLQRWILFKLQDNNDCPVLSKKEQGIIHMVSGLGFVWALSPILQSGVGINFRDVNGWTALHWAARFGREKMIAELIASGAYAGAVTDPSQQDPTGKTPASIASTYGHKGLAGYLSEVALTTHLSSLTLQESELSKCSADVEAERTVNSISNQNFVNEFRLSLKDTLEAVRNATQAASRIQAAFRAHSFKKNKQKEAVEYSSADEYGIFPSDIERLSKASKLVFGNARDHNAALSIQKKYRGYKGRKDFLALRRKVVKIQAHVRGHQARKNYETICWAVGIVEKIILRWHRKGVGLRGFHLDSIDDNVDDEDIMKVFRKQKVDVALSEAVSRVLSMVNSTQARQQYRRMLQKYKQAKAERGGLESEGGSTSQLVTYGD